MGNAAENMPGAKRDSAEEPSRRSSRKRVKVDYKEPSDSVVLGMGAESAAASTATGSVKEYRDTLIRQKKELYKDPPSLPPPEPEVLSKRSKEMSKHADGTLRCPDYPDFRPNLSPSEVLQMGSFGGTYYRPIESAVTGVSDPVSDIY